MNKNKAEELSKILFGLLSNNHEKGAKYQRVNNIKQLK